MCSVNLLENVINLRGTNHCGLAFLQDGVPITAVYLLSPDDVAGGVGVVDELAGGVVVQGAGVHQVLDGDHVLVGHLGVHVHAPDDARPAFTVHQEQLVFGP